MRVDACGQEVEQIKPFGIGDRQIVAHTAEFSETKESTSSALSGVVANPPPEVIRDESV